MPSFSGDTGSTDLATRRRVLRTAGGLVGLAAGGTTAVSGTAAAANVRIESVEVEGQQIALRFWEFGDGRGAVDMLSGGRWVPVVERYNVFISEFNDGLLYVGVMLDMTEDAETLGKITVAAVIAGLAAAVPTEGASTFLAAFAATMTVGILQDFVRLDRFSVGVREMQIFGGTYHFGTVKKGYSKDVGGTIPLTKPRPGGLAARGDR